ncbi:hypothetical protein EL17_09545 [Anditalea andensis]|uniref:DUF1440 domain-containing protein n=2 Tax=Anditalea andensis TaxID=1048983 RepID=A0A074KZV8_9BACT|nr:hypothetical protein EL17_09545 [Anditalea andensis]
MTLYSYLISKIERKNYREPRLLNKLIEKLPIPRDVHPSTGWILHYKVGFGFALFYHLTWNKYKPFRNMPTAITMGLINGLLGIGVWDRVFKIHPHPPDIDHRAFYRHLIIAHGIYGAGAYFGYLLTRERK